MSLPCATDRSRLIVSACVRGLIVLLVPTGLYLMSSPDGLLVTLDTQFVLDLQRPALRVPDWRGLALTLLFLVPALVFWALLAVGRIREHRTLRMGGVVAVLMFTGLFALAYTLLRQTIHAGGLGFQTLGLIVGTSTYAIWSLVVVPVLHRAFPQRVIPSRLGGRFRLRHTEMSSSAPVVSLGRLLGVLLFLSGSLMFLEAPHLGPGVLVFFSLWAGLGYYENSIGAAKIVTLSYTAGAAAISPLGPITLVLMLLVVRELRLFLSDESRPLLLVLVTVLSLLPDFTWAAAVLISSSQILYLVVPVPLFQIVVVLAAWRFNTYRVEREHTEGEELVEVPLWYVIYWKIRRRLQRRGDSR